MTRSHHITSIHVKSTWNRAKVGLEHSVSGSYYWLDMNVLFTDDDGTRKYYSLGSGHKGDEQKIFVFLSDHGFVKKGRQFMREWEYYEFVRPDIDDDPTSRWKVDPLSDPVGEDGRLVDRD